MNVLLYGLSIKQQNVPILQNLLQILQKESFKVFILKRLFNEMGSGSDPSLFTVLDHLDEVESLRLHYIFTLGGDGTILSACADLVKYNVPMLGLNLGRMGFLANVDPSGISDAIQMIKKGMYTIEERSMLHIESSLPVFEEAPYGLNDFTLLKRDTSSMIVIHTYINGDFLTSYWADGIIVSTPTGSTGYNLSCGGPIIFPDSCNFVLTPVAPHNLSVRPIVISDDSVLSFEVEGRSDYFLATLDSRHATITAQHQIAIRKSNYKTRLIHLQESSFLKTIREKLKWGSDTRNV